jgi:hypothetical protein
MSDPRARFHRVAPLILLWLLFIGVCWAGSEANAAVDDKADREQVNGYYAATFGRSGSDIVFVHYWSSGDMLRSETVLQGNPIVTIVRDNTYYCYSPLTRQGYAIKRNKRTIAVAAKLPRPFANELHSLLEDGGEKVRSDPLGAVTVDVYRATNDDGKRTLWVTNDDRSLPLRLESYSRASGRTTRPGLPPAEILGEGQSPRRCCGRVQRPARGIHRREPGMMAKGRRQSAAWLHIVIRYSSHPISFRCRNYFFTIDECIRSESGKGR